MSWHRERHKGEFDNYEDMPGIEVGLPLLMREVNTRLGSSRLPRVKMNLVGMTSSVLNRRETHMGWVYLRMGVAGKIRDCLGTVSWKILCHGECRVG